jgi:carbamate kinase
MRMDILIALGGNAILKENEKGTFREQESNIRDTAKRIAAIIKKGNNVIITHGNGPQVGDILLRYELAKSVLPTMPLHVCGGESQGMMGYMIEQAVANELKRAGISKEVACVLTQTVVDKRDPNFRNPSKPIGPFYGKADADRLSKEYGWTMVREASRYRRVVPSPVPVGIIEFNTIRRLFREGTVVVCAGGGGVPVIRNGKSFNGVDAVIDKDFGSSLLARKLKVDLFMILTDVDHVYLDYGKSGQRAVGKMSLEDCGRYLAEGHFENGTMRPKVEAAMEFVKATGSCAVITSLEKAEKALENKAGTRIAKG